MAKQKPKHPAQKGKTKKSTKQKVQAKEDAPIVYAPIPNVITLTRQTAQLLWLHKEILGGIALVNALIGLFLVRGLSAGINFADLEEQVGGFSAYGQLLANPSGAISESGAAYQSILSIVVTLATIWALRQLTAGEKITMRDAFYRGMFPLVPFIVILAVMGLQLLPTAIGLSIYQVAVAGGVISSVAETAVAMLGVFAVFLVSLHFLVSSIVALYIVTLPNMTPMLALQTSSRLLKGRRWTVLRKMAFLPVVLAVLIVAFTVPFVFLIPVLVSWVLFLFGSAALVASHAYLYNLYKGLLNEQQATE